MEDVQQHLDPQLLERVWSRVMEGRQGEGGPPPRQPEEGEGRDDRALLERMLAGEGEDRAFYRALARRAPAPIARQLLELAAQEEVHLGRLGAAYFVLTGHRPPPAPRGSRPVPGWPGGLREQYLQEVREGEAYRRAARACRPAWLAPLFEELADREEEQARRLYRLLERLD